VPPPLRGGPRPGLTPRPGQQAVKPKPRKRPLRRTSSLRRLNAALLSVAFAILLIVGRLIQLQGVESGKLRTLAEQERATTAPIPAVRGQITTSDGTVLAMTVQTDKVTAGPPQVKQSMWLSKAAAMLAGPLRMRRSVVLRLLRHPSSPDYVVLAGAVDMAAANAIAKLGIPGVNLTPSYARTYPEGDLAAGVVGFTNKSTGVITGEAGVEEAYNSLLTGRSGILTEEIGPDGPIPGTISTIRKTVPASSLRLTIQADIQWEAERECRLQVRATKAKTCSVIVMEPKTGRILALAQYPTFNPGKPVASIAQTTDIPLSAVFAPGSTAKVITAAAAFEYAGQTPLTSYVVPDAIGWHGAWYHDAESHPTKRYTIAGIIAHSLNDGMVQVADHVTPQQQYAEFRALGLGSYSGLKLPGESPGLLRPASQWAGDYRNERYQISFGQSVGVTAIQMADVYATIANGGVRVPPRLVAGRTTSVGKYIPARQPRGHRVMSRRTAAELISALEQVPLVYNRGGEPWGLIPGYTVAAKTGTAQEQGKAYGSSFIGIAPATSSNALVVAVNIQDPRNGSYFGIEVAGPVFNAVMKFALATMKIPPDHGHVPYVPLTVP
jgi:cell division protein FtsI (penicillin-binding protein 3)